MKTVKDLSLEELKHERDKLNDEIADLRKQSEDLMKKIVWRHDRLCKIFNAIDEQTLTPDDIEKLLETFPETKEKRKLRDKFLWQYYLRGDSYFPDTSQQCIKIALYKDSDEVTEKTYEGIMKVLPYVKPLPNNGYKTFDIFEHTLSQYESYYLCFDGKEWFVMTTRYSRENKIKTSESLLIILKYIQQNLYYEEHYDRY